MLIDFAAEHERYLKGKLEGGVWVFNAVNGSNPTSGIHLSTYQVFSNGGLGVALYIRNEFDEAGRAVKVHSGLKLLFSHKVNGRYVLAKDENRISLTLDIGACRHLYAWLAGAQPGFMYDLVRSGVNPRQISGFETGRAFPLTLRATEFSPNDGHRKIDVGLSDTDIFHIQMHCVALAKLLYPSMSDTALVHHMLPRTTAARAVVNEPTEVEALDHQPSQKGPEPTDSPATVEPPALAALPDIAKTKKAVFGVGKNQWPAKDIQTIQYIQENSTIEAMDRLIKAGNSGDFTEWNRIYSLVRSGRG
ncbi:hypothetical protein [Pseudomonas sp. NPDC089569]|uniref:hypothetical protein n=1 Tax=Pseudomonas sp. NPDC089569 TaxID=3390722 RepID=UPI003D006686